MSRPNDCCLQIWGTEDFPITLRRTFPLSESAGPVFSVGNTGRHLSWWWISEDDCMSAVKKYRISCLVSPLRLSPLPFLAFLLLLTRFCFLNYFKLWKSYLSMCAPSSPRRKDTIRWKRRRIILIDYFFFFFFSIGISTNHFLVNCFCIFYRWEISLLISYVFVNLTSHTLELKLNNLWYNNFAIIAMRRIMDWVPTHGNVNAMGNHLCFGVSTLVSFA